MRYRKLDSNGDMVFGHGQADFWINVPAAVAQAIETALRLIQGEWFLDLTKGVPWFGQVIGRNTLYDQVIKQAILGVDGVVSLGNYTSSYDSETRSLAVSDSGIITIYGTQALEMVIPLGGWGGNPWSGSPYGS